MEILSNAKISKGGDTDGTWSFSGEYVSNLRHVMFYVLFFSDGKQHPTSIGRN
jgi:hypothetical protein